MRAYHLLCATHALDDIQHRRLKIATVDDLNDPFELLVFAQPNQAIRTAMRRSKEEMARAYTVPTQQIHSSAANFLVRGTANSEGIEFDGGPKEQEADVALFCAHHILIDVLELQIEHFSLDTLNAQLEACRTDASHVWEAHEFRRQTQA